MKVDFRSPNITAATEGEQLLQIRSYLFQLRGQLQWAFENISTSDDSGSSGSVTVSSTQSAATTNPVSTFAALKGLIIKSADIVDAYYDEINSRLKGLYVAQSDFGTYTQETEQTIQGNSYNITQIFKNIQTIETNVGALQTLQQKTSAYIKTGLISNDSDEQPVYGLEIGQTNYDADGQVTFSKFARFCSDKLSFYDSNDTEVAYISDYKLYITNAEVTGSLRIAERFKIYYSNGLAFQWIGG